MSEITPKSVDHNAEISGASDAGKLLEAYLSARESATNNYELAQYQFATGERFLDLGDVESAIRFILLAENTNLQITARDTMNANTSAVNRFRAGLTELDETLKANNISLKRILDEFNGEFRSSTHRMVSAVQDMSRPVTQLNQAADTIFEASRRMGR